MIFTDSSKVAGIDKLSGSFQEIRASTLVKTVAESFFVSISSWFFPDDSKILKLKP